MSTDTGGGIGFAGLLTLLFIGFKLAGIIDWPWLLVLAPIWALLLLIIAPMAVFAIAHLFKRRR